MNRSLLLLAFMPLLSLADNAVEDQKTKQPTGSDAPTFNKRVVHEPSFTVYKGKPTATSPPDTVSEITEQDNKLKLLERDYSFTITEKEGKVMHGFPIAVTERVCGDVFIKNGGLFWGDKVMYRHFLRWYTMHNANTRSSINEIDAFPCMSRIAAQDYEPDHYFDESFSEKNLSEQAKLQAKLGAALLKKLIEANKQDNTVTSLPAQCTEINE